MYSSYHIIYNNNYLNHNNKNQPFTFCQTESSFFPWGGRTATAQRSHKNGYGPWLWKIAASQCADRDASGRQYNEAGSNAASGPHRWIV